MKAQECSQHFSHYKSTQIFFRCSRAVNSVDPGPILPNFKHIQAFITVLVTCKNDEDPFKNESTRVLRTLYIHFSNAQGQLTQYLVMGSGRNSNSFKLL